MTHGFVASQNVLEGVRGWQPQVQQDSKMPLSSAERQAVLRELVGTNRRARKRDRSREAVKSFV